MTQGVDPREHVLPFTGIEEFASIVLVTVPVSVFRTRFDESLRFVEAIDGRSPMTSAQAAKEVAAPHVP
jgi:hypothetical protein